MTDYCICCGRDVPEGRMVCPICEENAIQGKERGDRHKMKKEIVFMDEDTLTKKELQNTVTQEQTEERMKMYYDKWEEINGKTK